MKMILEVLIGFVEWGDRPDEGSTAHQHGDIVEMAGGAVYFANAEADNSKPAKIKPAFWLRLDLPEEPLKPAHLTWSIPAWFQQDLVDGSSGSWELDILYQDTVKTLVRGIDLAIEPERHDLLGFIEAWRLAGLASGRRSKKKRPKL